VNEFKKVPQSWRELSIAQQCVLFCAAEETFLLGVLAEWEPQGDWKHRSASIPLLAEATESLIRVEFIEVYVQQIPGDAAFLHTDEAIAVIKNPESWWHGEDDDDPSAGTEDRTVVIYNLLLTEKGADILQTRGNDPLYTWHDDNTAADTEAGAEEAAAP
jgi:hypothetical protein